METKPLTIPNICKAHREQVLKITLMELSERTGINIKTISAFENGRSSNMNHLFLYIDESNAEELDSFIDNMAEFMRGVNNEQ